MSCPACAKPALIAESTFEHACSDPDCVASRGYNRVTGLIPITWAIAGQWWPDACVLWDRDIAPEGWEPRLLVECRAAPACHTFRWTDDQHGRRLHSDEAVTRAEGPLCWMLHAHDATCTGLHVVPTDGCRCVRWAGDRWTSAVMEFEFTNLVGATGADLTVENLLEAQRRLGWMDAAEFRSEYLGEWMPVSIAPLEPVGDRADAIAYARRRMVARSRRR